MEDLCVETQVPGLRLLSGAATFLGTAHPQPEHRRRFIRQLRTLDADVVLIDLGAGAHYTTLDFFTVAGHRLIVSSPEPTSIQNTYGFLKAAAFRRLELALSEEPGFDALFARAVKPRGDDRLESIGQFIEAVADENPTLAARVRTEIDNLKPLLVINQAGLEDEKRVYGALAVVCHRYLSFKPEHAGTLPDDPSVRVAVRRMRPVLLDAPDSAFGRCVGQLVERVLSQRGNPGFELVLDASHRAAEGTQLEAMNQLVTGRDSQKDAQLPDEPQRSEVEPQEAGIEIPGPPDSLADALARVEPAKREDPPVETPNESDAHVRSESVETDVAEPGDVVDEQVGGSASNSAASEEQATADQTEYGTHAESTPTAKEPLLEPPAGAVNPEMTLESDEFPDAIGPLLGSEHHVSTMGLHQLTDTGEAPSDSLGNMLDQAIDGDLSSDSVPDFADHDSLSESSVNHQSAEAWSEDDETDHVDALDDDEIGRTPEPDFQQVDEEDEEPESDVSLPEHGGTSQSSMSWRSRSRMMRCRRYTSKMLHPLIPQKPRMKEMRMRLSQLQTQSRTRRRWMKYRSS